jgi:multimeric flavodoxin WrbA
MKLLAINGSHRKTQSINQLLIDNLFMGARESGAECETLKLAELRINHRISCEWCQDKKEYSCIYDEKDDFVKIIQKTKEADILIFATPIYLFQMSSLMKTFLERYHSRGKSKIRIITRSHLIFHDFESELRTKPFVTIIVSDNIERKTTENVNTYFETFSKFMDARRVGNIIRNGSIIFKDATDFYAPVANEVLMNLKIAGKELALKGYITKKTENKINRDILPIPKILFAILKRIKAGKLKILERIS